MAKDHGLAGLFGDEGTPNEGEPLADPMAADDELPPVLDDADKSPFEILTDKLAADDEPFEPIVSEPQAPPVEPLQQMAADEETEEPEDEIDISRKDTGILCFLLEGGDDRERRRTLGALNMAAGNGNVMLRSLPSDPDAMDQALATALATTECTLAVFLSPGTEPADDWAIECLAAFREAPRTSAMAVQAANSDPLSPWARVAFFIDEAERQKGIARGHDTVVFRVTALQELGDSIGTAVRTGNILPAIRGMGHRFGIASEARVTLASPAARRDVIKHVKEQARLAAQREAASTNIVLRPFKAIGVLMSFPFRVMEVRAAAKRTIGGTQFREVAPKAAMAILADRRVRAATLLRPGKKKRR